MQWNIYAVNKVFEKRKTAYYQVKAKVDTIKNIINQGKAQITEEEASANVVELNTDEMSGIKDAILKYTCFKQPGQTTCDTPQQLKAAEAKTTEAKVAKTVSDKAGKVALEAKKAVDVAKALAEVAKTELTTKKVTEETTKKAYTAIIAVADTEQTLATTMQG